MNISKLRLIYHAVLGTTDSFYTTAFMTLHQSITYQPAYNQYTATDKIDLTELRVRHLISETKILVSLRIRPGWSYSFYFFYKWKQFSILETLTDKFHAKET